MSGGADASGPTSRPRALERHEPAGRHLDGTVGERSDLVGAVDRGDRDRRILRRAQRLVTAQLMVRAEAGDAAQHDAGGHRTLTVEIEQRVGEEAVAAAQTFGEVGGQLEVLVAHRQASDPQAEPGCRETEHQADDDVGDGGPQLAFLAESLGLQHPGREGRVGADERGAHQQREVRAQRETG